MNTVSSSAFVTQAVNGHYLGIPYSKLDCQAFVEQVLKDCGVRNAYGKPYNWRGSNHMWREAVSDRTAKADGAPPPGAWVFTIKHDGGEIARGYHDNMGNAAHIGIYLGDNLVMHSTTGGVQMDKWSSSRWTHFALATVIKYDPHDRCLCSQCIVRVNCERWAK